MVCQTYTVELLDEVDTSHWKFAGLNWMLLLRSSTCAITKIGMKVPMVVPSLGAWLKT